MTYGYHQFMTIERNVSCAQVLMCWILYINQWTEPRSKLSEFLKIQLCRNISRMSMWMWWHQFNAIFQRCHKNIVHSTIKLAFMTFFQAQIIVFLRNKCFVQSVDLSLCHACPSDIISVLNILILTWSKRNFHYSSRTLAFHEHCWNLSNLWQMYG